MDSSKIRLFIPFGLAFGLLILALGLLQGAMLQIEIGVAMLAVPILFRVLHALFRNPQPAMPETAGHTVRNPYDLAYRAVTTLVIASMLVGMLPPPALASAAAPQPLRTMGTSERPAARPDGRPNYLPPKRSNQPPGTFWADLDGDRDVDEADLQWIAQFWNCAAGDPCYDATLDFNTDGIIDALDMAYVGNEYDITPPALAVTSPADRAVVGGATVNVTGVISDKHAVNVTVNGVAATLSPLLAGEGSGVGSFTASVPVSPGNQALHVIATDEVGQAATSSRLVGVDADGPMIEVHAPEHRQSVYTLRPTIAMSYTDFYMAVNPATLQVLLTDAGGTSTDVTGDLIADADGASGQVSFDLTEDTAYTILCGRHARQRGHGPGRFLRPHRSGQHHPAGGAGKRRLGQRRGVRFQHL